MICVDPRATASKKTLSYWLVVGWVALASAAFAGTSDGTVVGTTTIVDNGDPASKVNLVILAEGFTQAELDLFHTEAQDFVDDFFATSPFDRHRGRFNVFRIDVASTESGADVPCINPAVTVATYFDATYCSGGIERALVVDDSTVLSVLNSQVPEWTTAIVLVNSTRWGGTGGFISVTSRSNGWHGIATHEMGHTLFNLADEYEYYAGCGSGETGHDTYAGSEPVEVNVTKNTSRATIKWASLVAASTPLPSTTNADCTHCDTQSNPLLAGTVGAFEGAKYYHCALYRPAFSCKMRSTGSGFCPVCSARIDAVMAAFTAAATRSDFDGDGKPDILWRNSSTGQNYVWYMNGTVRAGGA